MADERERRAAIVEAAFRIANDRMAAWEEASATEPELFFCECMDPGCRAKVPLTREEYERVRADPLRFFVAPGHEDEDLEAVVERTPTHHVIEKPPEIRGLAAATDPRSSEEGGEDADEARELADGIG
jgi:hypothetical protein